MKKKRLKKKFKNMSQEIQELINDHANALRIDEFRKIQELFRALDKNEYTVPGLSTIRYEFCDRDILFVDGCKDSTEMEKVVPARPNTYS